MFAIFKILRQRSRFFYVYAVLLGGLTSASHFAIIYMINQTITFKPIAYVQQYDWLAFIAVLVISYLSSKTFQKYLIRLVNDVGYEYNVNIFETLRKTSYQQLEIVSREKVYTAMDDVDRLSYLPIQFVSLLNSTIMLTCGVVYMFSLSLRATVAVLCMLSMLVAFLIYRNTRIKGRMKEIRELENDFYKYLNDLLLGFREVLMSSTRNNNLYKKYVLKNRRRSRDLRITTSFFYLNNELVNSYGWYVIVGVIVFGISRLSEMGIAGAVSFTLIVFYIMGPIGALIRFMPIYTRMKISYDHLTKFMETLSNTPVNTAPPRDSLDDFQSLSVEGVSFEYNKNGGDGFTVGPISMEIGKGEVVFITGGNGSGKSTFVHLLTGIFPPSGGKFYYNGQEVDTASSAYRDKISVIFTDPFVFAFNYEDYKYSDVKPELDRYSSTLRMNEILKIDYEKDKIDKGLSKGQQKRLSLIHAMLESKPVIVMDEWAAEQDPQFRRYFYRNILPSLKAEGKTLILITHDDQYFDCADRILKFEYGNIIESHPIYE